MLKVFKNMIFISVFALLLSSCSNFTFLKGCPDAEIEWVDVLMINDIEYEHYSQSQRMKIFL